MPGDPQIARHRSFLQEAAEEEAAVEEPEGDGAAGRAPTYRLRYTVGKTKKRQSLILVPQAVEIGAPYLDRPAGGYLFDALDRYLTGTPEGLDKGLRSRNAFVNLRLTDLAERAEIKKGVSFHVARHTFADLARKRGWSLYDINRVLRHGGLGETDGYLDAQMLSLFASGRKG